MARRVALVEVHILGLDDQVAPVRHGVPRVDREVHNHLLDLPRVGLNASEFRRQRRPQLYVFADQATELCRAGGMKKCP